MFKTPYLYLSYTYLFVISTALHLDFTKKLPDTWRDKMHHGILCLYPNVSISVWWGSGFISRHGSLFPWNDSTASIKASLVSHLMLLPAHLWGACLCLISWVIRCASTATHLTQSRTEQAITKCHTLPGEKGSTVDLPHRQSSSTTKLFSAERGSSEIRTIIRHAITFRVFPIERWRCVAMNQHRGGSFWGVMFPCIGSDVWNERISVAKKSPVGRKQLVPHMFRHSLEEKLSSSLPG